MTYQQSKVMKYGGSQSKLFDYLASGKPVINCGDWGYNLISRYNCGIVVKEQTSVNIANAIEILKNTSEEILNSMGNNARHVAEIYAQPNLVDKLIEVLHYVDKKR